jgi:RNA polymerase primary sigma factor
MTTDPIHDYLRAIGKTPLLTAAEELELARAVQAMLPLLSEQNPMPAQVAVIHRGKRAKQRMIQANLRLVVAIAKKYQNRGLDMLDLIQEGSLGLERAVDKFDPTKGYKFSTYAYWWIRQGMTRALNNDARMIRLPIHVQEKLSKIKTTTRTLAGQLGRRPTIDELASALGMSLEEMRNLLSRQRRCASLDMLVGQEQETRLGDLIPDEQQQIRWESAIAMEQCQQYLSCLTDKEREVITLRYGLHDGKHRSLAEVGEVFGFSRERARQIETKAMRKLRQVATVSA